MNWLLRLLGIAKDKSKKIITDVIMKPAVVVKKPIIVEPTPVIEANPFTIENDLLYKDGKKVTTNTSPHVSKGSNICDFIIIHYTGSHGDYNSSINWSKDPKSKVSWHLTVSRDGEIKQNSKGLRSILWHAGKSTWYSAISGKNYSNLNSLSIGIELANSGKLTWHNTKQKYLNYYKHEFEAEDVFVDKNGQAWEKYGLDQIKTAKHAAFALAKRYSCVAILGHEDIAPGRKTDPGPAFPLGAIQKELKSQEWYKFNK